MDEFPVDDPAAREADGVVTLLQYLIGYTKVASPFRRGIDDNKTLTGDSVNDLAAVFLAERRKDVGFLGYTSKILAQ